MAKTDIMKEAMHLRRMASINELFKDIIPEEVYYAISRQITMRERENVRACKVNRQEKGTQR